MWKVYSKNYIKNNRAASISIMVAVLISSVFISAICAIFYNMWTDNIDRLVAKDGAWHGKIIGNLTSAEINTIENSLNVDKVVFHQDIKGEAYAEIYLKNPKNVYQELPELAKQMEMDEGEDIDLQYNNMLLTQYYIYSPEEKKDPPLLMTFYIFVMIVTCFSLAMIIYNAFGITMNSRLHQLGILQSVGATPKQIRTALMQESFALSLLPILSGIALGIAIDCGFIKFANVIGDINNRTDAKFSYHPLVLLVTFAVCVLTVYAASARAAKKLSKVMPLEAICGGAEPPVKKVKKYRLLSALFGIEGELARKSLYTRRKAFRTASISLTLSILMFSFFLNFMTLSDMSTQQSYFERYKDAWDLMITLNSTDKGAEEQENLLLNEIRNIPKVSDCAAYGKAQAYTWIDKKMLSAELNAIGGIDVLGDVGIIKDGEKYLVPVPIVILDDKSFQLYCKENGIGNTQAMESGAVTVNRIWDNIHSDFRNREFLPFIKETNGRILELLPEKVSYRDTNIDTNKDTNKDINKDTNKGNKLQTKKEMKTLSMKIGTYTDQVPNLREEYHYFSFLQIMSAEFYQTFSDNFAENERYFRILADSDKEIEQIERKLTTILDKGGYDYTLENRKSEEAYNTMSRKGLNIIMGILCGMLAFIGLANVFANTLGSIYQRKREFARYISIGLTPGGVKKILFMEALIISMKPLLICLPLNILFVIFSVYLKYGDFLKIMPVMPLFVMAMFIIVTVGVAYYISGRKICRADIVDALKDETML